MTIDELIDEAARLGGWRLTPLGQIRQFSGHCPLTAVSRINTVYSYDTLCATLKITIGDAGIIMRAADNTLRNEKHIISVRNRMLQAFGLADPTPARVDVGTSGRK